MTGPEPRRVGRGLARVCLHHHGATRWWDAVTMDDGVRRVLREGPADADGLIWAPDPADRDAAWSPPLSATLAELLPLPGEPTPDDAPLAAAVAAAGLVAAREGRLGAGEGLANRVVCVGARWVVLGGAEPREGGYAALAAALRALDPEDSLALAALAADPPPEAERLLVRSLAVRLASDRHTLARRAAADRRTDLRARLRALAARLAAAAPPPAYAGGGAASDGRALVAGDRVVFDGVRLDPRAARALARALPDEPAAQRLRRWLRAMSHLRVDRELLARAGA